MMILNRIKKAFHSDASDRDFALFLLVGVFSGVALGINSTVFNNFLSDVYKLSAQARGIVEIPRELPGVFIMVVLGLLAFLGDMRMATIGFSAASLGMLGLGLFSPTYASMLLWLMMFSLGTHMVMPITPVIGMELSKKENYGARLGRYSAYNLSATIGGYVIVWVGFKYFGLTYHIAFVIASIFFIFAAISMSIIKSKKPELKKVRFVFKKKYTLYYILCIVNGARKQIFLTFAPWVLIQAFHIGPPVFAILGVIVAAVSILTRTIVGKAIDIKGERFILSLEAVLLFVICIGYAYAEDVFSAGVAVVVIAACYIVDNSMNAVEMARSTYVKKITDDPADVVPTLSAGTSLDHIVSMSIPFLGGMLWMSLGYKYVFIFAAGIALINLMLSRKIKIL